jgi:hypothetical protein
MSAGNITTATFTLQGPGGAAVGGTVSYSGTTATFNPTADLALSTVYTATITTGAQDAAGNALAANYTWSFTTSSGSAKGAVLTQTLSGVGTTGGTEAGFGQVFNLLAVTTNLVADATPEDVDLFDYVNNADVDQIGATWAALPLATWRTAFTNSGLTATEASALLSVTYNATTNELVFTFANNNTGSTITAEKLLSASLIGNVGNAVLTGFESAVGFTP